MGEFGLSFSTGGDATRFPSPGLALVVPAGGQTPLRAGRHMAASPHRRYNQVRDLSLIHI
eukprot:11841632-Alexandrium_andersonii.AAC.1